MFLGSTFCLMIRAKSLETKEKKSTRGYSPRVGYSTEWPFAPLDVHLPALESAPPVILPLFGTAKLLTFQQTSKKFSKNFICSTTYKKGAWSYPHALCIIVDNFAITPSVNRLPQWWCPL